MALARYKDLCIDAVDAEPMAMFWASVLGLRQDPSPDPPYRLLGDTEQDTVWVNPVPEPKTVKHRMHLDVNAGSVEEITALGARVLDAQSFPWTVLADPEGGEFCVFVREGTIEHRLYELALDCADSAAIAAWWAGVLGARLVHDERGFSYIEEIPGTTLDSLSFAPVPEPKTVKNRVHFDVDTHDVEALVAAGASVVRAADEEVGWYVLADPEGNEFCAFVQAE